ncbi:MAG: hypothetical protein QM764_20290 [Chitinophagaceae bacterium]
MKRMKFYWIMFATIITVFSCSKQYTQPAQQTDAIKLLTQQPWKIASYGYDRNINGIIDGNEDEIRDCEQNTMYVFEKNGSGSVVENGNCGENSDDTNMFTWSLTNGDSVLDFVYARAIIEQLTKDNLIIKAPNAEPVKFFVVYKH